jgi:hypothetical protein
MIFSFASSGQNLGAHRLDQFLNAGITACRVKDSNGQEYITLRGLRPLAEPRAPIGERTDS